MDAVENFECQQFRLEVQNCQKGGMITYFGCIDCSRTDEVFARCILTEKLHWYRFVPFKPFSAD